MRQIKFRAWDKKNKRWLENGDIAIGLDGTEMRYHLAEHSEIEIMQFTGLTDKNGKEIYEGDIVSINGGIPIKICWGYSEWECRTSQEEIATSFSGFHDEMEIIGNIYESGHLLDNTDKKV